VESLSGSYSHGVVEEQLIGGLVGLFVLLESVSERDLDITVYEAVWGCHWVVQVRVAWDC
jgi:hypothetical protein